MLFMLLLGIVSGCSTGASYNLHLLFPGDDARQAIDQIEIWALEPGGHDCGDFEGQGLAPQDLVVISGVVVKKPFTENARLGRVSAGPVMFVAEGSKAPGVKILRGCAVAEVKAGSTIEVTVELACICNAASGNCAPEDEIIGNGLDDDCDGMTDECDEDLDCNDDNGCTQDFCLESRCHWQNWPDTTGCSDGDICTVDDACSDGICTGAGKDCSELDGVCIEGICNPESGACEARAAPDGTACDDNRWCTQGDECVSGKCSGVERTCADTDPCTRDSCDENTDTCLHEVVPRPGAEGPTGAPTCSNGSDDDCDGMTDLADANCNACQQDAECDDGNECTLDSCVEQDCYNIPVADETPCSDDGVFCNGVEVCRQGVCTHSGNPCPGADGDGDCSESCAEDLRSCTADDPQDAACDDGNWCTVSDTCTSGVCSGSERDCDDGDTCTQDGCDEEADTCQHQLTPLPGAEGPAENPTCGNGIDDDCDGFADELDADCLALEWVPLGGGTFMMGSEAGLANETPIHAVTVPPFEMTRSEITVAQYQACVAAGICSPPRDNAADERCNWGTSGRGSHPVNCIAWNQAVAFCTWAGGRLPSEAEWEYAARSGGQDVTYPWGNVMASCQYAVMDETGDGCGLNSTWPVCSKPDGDTAQGLCDMAGNVWEWVQDWYHSRYDGAPTDGSAWEVPETDKRVLRGGAWLDEAYRLRATMRPGYDPEAQDSDDGFRCARNAP